MSETHCERCGYIVQPSDYFCRKCGSSLGSTTFSSEHSDDVSVNKSTLPADKPIYNITIDDLDKIWEKWDKYKRPDGFRYKAPEIIELPYLKVVDLIFLLGRTNPQAATSIEQKLNNIISPCFLLCSYIGYEQMSGGITTGNCTPYLAKATEPIRTLLLSVLDKLVMSRIISGDEGKSKAIEIATITNQAAEKAYILGVDNYQTVRKQSIANVGGYSSTMSRNPPVSKQPVTEAIHRTKTIQESLPKKEHQKSSPAWWIIIAVLFVIGGVILVPIIAPDLANERPGTLLLYGGSFFVIGVIAWLLEWSGKVRFVGRGYCCLFFPLIGLFVFYSLIHF